ncbi:hypothetical protein ACN47E_007200 [Coniothyrium glycines]
MAALIGPVVFGLSHLVVPAPDAMGAALVAMNVAAFLPYSVPIFHDISTDISNHTFSTANRTKASPLFWQSKSAADATISSNVNAHVKGFVSKSYVPEIQHTRESFQTSTIEPLKNAVVVNKAIPSIVRFANSTTFMPSSLTASEMVDPVFVPSQTSENSSHAQRPRIIGTPNAPSACHPLHLPSLTATFNVNRSASTNQVRDFMTILTDKLIAVGHVFKSNQNPSTCAAPHIRTSACAPHLPEAVPEVARQWSPVTLKEHTARNDASQLPAHASFEKLGSPKHTTDLPDRPADVAYRVAMNAFKLDCFRVYGYIAFAIMVVISFQSQQRLSDLAQHGQIRPNNLPAYLVQIKNYIRVLCTVVLEENLMKRYQQYPVQAACLIGIQSFMRSQYAVAVLALTSFFRRFQIRPARFDRNASCIYARYLVAIRTLSVRCRRLRVRARNLLNHGLGPVPGAVFSLITLLTVTVLLATFFIHIGIHIGCIDSSAAAELSKVSSYLFSVADDVARLLRSSYWNSFSHLKISFRFLLQRSKHVLNAIHNYLLLCAHSLVAWKQYLSAPNSRVCIDLLHDGLDYLWAPVTIVQNLSRSLLEEFKSLHSPSLEMCSIRRSLPITIRTNILLGLTIMFALQRSQIKLYLLLVMCLAAYMESIVELALNEPKCLLEYLPITIALFAWGLLVLLRRGHMVRHRLPRGHGAPHNDSTVDKDDGLKSSSKIDRDDSGSSEANVDRAANNDDDEGRHVRKTSKSRDIAHSHGDVHSDPREPSVPSHGDAERRVAGTDAKWIYHCLVVIFKRASSLSGEVLLETLLGLVSSVVSDFLVQAEEGRAFYASATDLWSVIPRRPSSSGGPVITNDSLDQPQVSKETSSAPEARKDVLPRAVEDRERTLKNEEVQLQSLSTRSLDQSQVSKETSYNQNSSAPEAREDVSPRAAEDRERMPKNEKIQLRSLPNRPLEHSISSRAEIIAKLPIDEAAPQPIPQARQPVVCRINHNLQAPHGTNRLIGTQNESPKTTKLHEKKAYDPAHELRIEDFPLPRVPETRQGTPSELAQFRNRLLGGPSILMQMRQELERNNIEAGVEYFHSKPDTGGEPIMVVAEPLAEDPAGTSAESYAQPVTQLSTAPLVEFQEHVPAKHAAAPLIYISCTVSIPPSEPQPLPLPDLSLCKSPQSSNDMPNIETVPSTTVKSHRRISGLDIFGYTGDHMEEDVEIDENCVQLTAAILNVEKVSLAPATIVEKDETDTNMVNGGFTTSQNVRSPSICSSVDSSQQSVSSTASAKSHFERPKVSLVPNSSSAEGLGIVDTGISLVDDTTAIKTGDLSSSGTTASTPSPDLKPPPAAPGPHMPLHSDINYEREMDIDSVSGQNDISPLSPVNAEMNHDDDVPSIGSMMDIDTASHDDASNDGGEEYRVSSAGSPPSAPSSHDSFDDVYKDEGRDGEAGNHVASNPRRAISLDENYDEDDVDYDEDGIDDDDINNDDNDDDDIEDPGDPMDEDTDFDIDADNAESAYSAAFQKALEDGIDDMLLQERLERAASARVVDAHNQLPAVSERPPPGRAAVQPAAQVRQSCSTPDSSDSDPDR